jgi:hypothetical protein
MSIFSNPFDAKTSLGCSCGRHATEADHAAASNAEGSLQDDALNARAVEQAVMRALFPRDDVRRRFLQAVGAPTALAAISSIFPLGLAQEVFAQGAGKLEKTKLSVGFIPITCATPIIMAQPMGFYKKQGLDVEVVKTAGWAVIRDKTLNGEYDAAQADSLHDARGREHQRAGHHAGDEAQGPARPEDLEGLQVCRPVRLLDAQLPAALLRRRGGPRPGPRHPDPLGTAAGDGGQPARRQH